MHEELSSLAQDLLVGHQPPRALAPQDQALFRSFQRNLLSLISHELRTPLMGVINSLTVLEEADESQRAEFTLTAKRNAQRLQNALVTLLDLAAIESQNFHAQLRETELVRLARACVAIKGGKIQMDFPKEETLILADVQKIERAIDLCLDCALAAANGGEFKVRISSTKGLAFEIQFELASEQTHAWEQAWSLGVAGAESGVGLPTSAFGGVLQSEEEFLSRTGEGLGSEFLLLHEIMRLHSGKFEQQKKGASITLRLLFPELSSEEALKAVLLSRAYELSSKSTAVAVVLVRADRGGTEELRTKLKNLLYRTTDSAFVLKDEVAIVMNDYPKKDMMKFVERVRGAFPQKHAIAMAHFPEDVADPLKLLEETRRKYSK